MPRKHLHCTMYMIDSPVTLINENCLVPPNMSYISEHT